jgi:hypothetical protein
MSKSNERKIKHGDNFMLMFAKGARFRQVDPGLDRFVDAFKNKLQGVSPHSDNFHSVIS